MKTFAGSIRWRMTLSYSVSISLIYLVFACCVFLTFRYGCIAESRARLDNELALVTQAISGAPDRLSTIAADFPASDFYVLADQRALYASPGWVHLGIAASAPFDSNGYAFRASPTGRHYAIRKIELRLGGRTVEVGLAQDGQQTFENVRRLLLVLLVSVPVILTVSLVWGCFLAGRFLRPIGEMARKANEITADHLSHRLPVGKVDDELNRLARVFNETLTRLEDSFGRLNRFTADASHELRTPLAVIRALGENALRGSCKAVRYEEAIGSILEETDRMSRLLSGLLTLTRAKSERPPLHFDDVSLNEISIDVVNCLRVLAEEKEQTLVFEGRADLTVRLDAPTFKQALINLLANAIQYTQAGGEITVRVRQSERKGALVEVDDNGPGIAPEHRQHIFQRFYRIDKDRSQAAGGSGLGLAIARWAIDLNGGTVEFEAKQVAGSLFRIALPAIDGRHRSPADAMPIPAPAP